METLFENVKINSKAFLNNDIKDIQYPEGKEGVRVQAFCCQKPISFECNGGGTLYIPKLDFTIGKHAFQSSRNGYGVWFSFKRKILCLPVFVNLDICKKLGISRDQVEKYLEGK